MFVRFPDSKDKFLNALKGNRIKMRKYPDVVRAMYAGEEIPEDLRPEENLHKSMLINEMEDHLSKRQSMAQFSDQEIGGANDDY